VYRSQAKPHIFRIHVLFCWLGNPLRGDNQGEIQRQSG
jgi:hypothetical protein